MGVLVVVAARNAQMIPGGGGTFENGKPKYDLTRRLLDEQRGAAPRMLVHASPEQCRTMFPAFTAQDCWAVPPRRTNSATCFIVGGCGR